jgi:ribonuclease E
MKDALKNDRARIQVGRISSFGLMEMSRQRLRTGVLEASTKPCPHCEGTGLMRTAASAGLSALRILEDEAARGRGERICLRAGKEAAVYVLNKKRAELADIEQRYGVMIEVQVDESFEGARMTVDSSGPRPVAVPRQPVALVEEDEEELEPEAIEAEDEEEQEEAEPREGREAQGEGDRQERKRRRRRRGGRGRGRREGGEPLEAGEAVALEAAEEPGEDVREDERAAPVSEESREGGRRRRRRRGRGGAPETTEAAEPAVAPDSSPMVERPIDEEPPIAETQPMDERQPAAPKRGRRKKATAETEVTVPEPAPPEAPPAETAEDAAQPEKPARRRRAKKAEAEPADASAEPPAAGEPATLPAANNDTADDADGEPRRGWWQRTFG